MGTRRFAYDSFSSDGIPAVMPVCSPDEHSLCTPSRNHATYDDRTWTDAVDRDISILAQLNGKRPRQPRHSTLGGTISGVRGTRDEVFRARDVDDPRRLAFQEGGHAGTDEDGQCAQVDIQRLVPSRFEGLVGAEGAASY